MKIYRYYYEAVQGYEEMGFLIRMSELFEKVKNDNEEIELFKLVGIFEDNLPAPPNEFYFNNSNARSYFTEKGNRKFKKAINNIRKYLLNKYQWELICKCKDIRDNDSRILYSDDLQVILNENNSNNEDDF